LKISIKKNESRQPLLSFGVSTAIRNEFPLLGKLVLKCW